MSTRTTGNLVLGAFSVALVVRLLLLVYGVWQDQNMLVKYTDVDYRVFTDAAGFVQRGQSPYERATYRYTPLLAFMMVFNHTLHESFGKVVFVLLDLVCGVLIYRMLRIHRGLSAQHSILWSLLWLFNPMVINVSTRGNAESIICALVLGTLYCLLQRRLFSASVLYGVAVHFKVYPIIYVPAILLFLDEHYVSKQPPHPSNTWRLWSRITCLFNRYRILFALVSFLSFALLSLSMFALYGDEFLENTYLYHLSRVDFRHNFSLYFYHLYLNHGMGVFGSRAVSLWRYAPFLPQAILVPMFAFLFAKKDLSYTMLLQTFVFVMFNKVCTVQYFLWYFCLLPLVLPRCYLTWYKYAGMSFMWMITQGFWLYFAYELEFLGNQTFLMVWFGSLLFFMANLWILCEIILGRAIYWNWLEHDTVKVKKE
mmetsp:Transcript_53372/g.134010  ORF Transcript_53372/g.134010 Transcript_53372/m.134010 type:complete len:425 (-) Transcript_53372:66-1340(-)